MAQRGFQGEATAAGMRLVETTPGPASRAPVTPAGSAVRSSGVGRLQHGGGSPATPDVRLHNHVVVVAARSPLGGTPVNSMVRQLSLDQFENEGRRVRDYDSDVPFNTPTPMVRLGLPHPLDPLPVFRLESSVPRLTA